MNKSFIQKQIQALFPKINQPQKFVKDIELLFKSIGDKKSIATSKRTIPNAEKIFGVSFPIQNVIALEINKIGASDAEAVLNLLKALWQSSSLEAQIITAKILAKIGKKEPKKCLNLIKLFLPGINNWAVCDTLATQGLRGIMPIQKNEIFALAIKCVKNKNKWIKRFGVVTIVELAHNKKLAIFPRVFEIIKPLMSVQDPDLKKAVSWTLREISKREPQMVKNFLSDYQNSHNKNTQWIIREGSKKL